MKHLFKIYLIILCVFNCYIGYCQSAASVRDDRDTKEAAAADGNGETYIHFVGNGDIQKSLSEGTGIAANTGVGVIFTRIWGEQAPINSWFEELNLDVRINIASTADSLSVFRNTATNGIDNRRLFGTYILLPINSSQAAVMNSSFYLKDSTWLANIYISGFQARFIASNLIWRDGINQYDISAMSLRIGAFHEFLPTDKRRNNNMSITLGANYSGRFIGGDVSFREFNSFREELLSTKQTMFHGVEFNLGIRLHNIRAEFALPVLFGDTHGLSGMQFITSIAFVGGFPLKLN